MFSSFADIVLAAKRQYEYRWNIFMFRLNANCLCIGQMSGFCEFIPNFSDYTEQIQSFSNIAMSFDQFTSINCVYLIHFELTSTYIDYLKPILSQLEVVRVQDCRFEHEFYKSFLHHCVNIKRLYLEDIELGRHGFRAKNGQNRWFLQKYPSIEHLQLTPRTGDKIHELKELFERNSNIRSFTINSYYLYENWMSLIDTKANLDVLIVDFNRWPRIYMDTMSDLLNFLHQKGFYKRLHLYMPKMHKLPADDTATLNALEKLHIKQLHFKQYENVFVFKKVKELVVSEITSDTNMEVLAKDFSDLKRVYLKIATSDHIVAFLRHSRNLREIHVETLAQGSHCYGRILDISKLNKEREKLKGAKKVKIFVNKHVFTMSKLANTVCQLSHIRLKRIGLQKFNQKFELDVY